MLLQRGNLRVSPPRRLHRTLTTFLHQPSSCETPSDVKHSVLRGSGRDAHLLNGWLSARRCNPVISLTCFGPPDRSRFASTVDSTAVPNGLTAEHVINSVWHIVSDSVAMESRPPYYAVLKTSPALSATHDKNRIALAADHGQTAQVRERRLAHSHRQFR